MRIQSSHHHADRGLDPYFSPPEAAWSLLHLETENLPDVIWEPAAGDGALVIPFQKAGFTMLASDLVDYGLHGCISGLDYLTAEPMPEAKGIVTYPPYRLAVKFAEKALKETPYVALLLRTNFLESTSRMPFFQKHPPARIWISSRRLPMMHTHGWQGPQATNNTCFAWFIWDERSEQKRVVDWFDWKEITRTVGHGLFEQAANDRLPAAA